MDRNSAGKIVGHVFEFATKELARFADWLDGFSGVIRGKTGTASLHIDLNGLEGERLRTAIELLKAKALP